MQQYSIEKIINNLDVNVYPITFIKYLLNQHRILGYFQKASNNNFKIKTLFKIDNNDCNNCIEKESEGLLCRQHTSIDRVLNADKVAFDLETETYLYKNEIFKMVNGRLVIVYCPHSKLIAGEITDAKVRKINPITIEDSNLISLPQYEKISEFASSELLNQHIRCWFNNEFSLITIPNDKIQLDWCLVANK